MKKIEIEDLLKYKSISKSLNEYKNIKEEFEKDNIKNMDTLIEIIELYQRTLNFLYNQLKITNIAINHNEKEDACEILKDCQDIINSAMLMTDIDYEDRGTDIKFIDFKRNILINDLSDLENLVSKIINNNINNINGGDNAI